MAAPTKITQLYNAGGVAPHALTQRWTYTVPAGRFAILEAAFAQVLRDGGAGAAGYVINYVQYTPSGGAATRIVQTIHLSVAADRGDKAVWGSELRLMAGDVLAGFTLDAATGGTNLHVLAATLTEYDE